MIPAGTPNLYTINGVTYINGVPSSYYTQQTQQANNSTEEKSGWQNFLSGLGTVLSGIFGGTTAGVGQSTVPNYPQNTVQSGGNNILIIALVAIIILLVTKTIKI